MGRVLHSVLIVLVNYGSNLQSYRRLVLCEQFHPQFMNTGITFPLLTLNSVLSRPRFCPKLQICMDHYLLDYSWVNPRYQSHHVLELPPLQT